jgi:hypothetical protein
MWMSLTQFANEFKTDKGTATGNSHAYTCLYDMLFSGMRELPIKLMEIGLSAGGPELGGSPERAVADAPSLRLWHRYFPKAQIYGVDISDFSQFQADYFTFYRTDCGDRDALARVARAAPPCDIIIDDGSHASYHQQLTFGYLFSLVKSGGLYIIEDMDWQPSEYERTLPKVPKTTALLTGFIESGKLSWSNCLNDFKERKLESQIANVFLYSTEMLNRSGRLHNKLIGIGETNSLYQKKETTSKAYAARVVNALLGSAGVQMTRPPSIKLAVIQKK